MLNQLADDTTLFLRDENSLSEALNTISTFSLYSGLRLNKEKSEAFWIGKDKENTRKPCKLKWTNGSVKCLGIFCNTDVDLAVNQNYEYRIDKLKTVLNIWSQRNLSLKGKVAVLRSIALPQLLYVTSVLYTPNWVIETVDRMMFDFLWSKKKHFVSKAVVISEIENGGIKMPHFESMVKALKCRWIKRLVDNDFKRIQILKTFIKYKQFDVKTILQYVLDNQYLSFNSSFYEQILMCWYGIHSREPNTLNEVLQTMLWHNKYITIGEQPVVFQDWIKKGIQNIRHVVDDNGNILSKNELEMTYGCNIKQMSYNSLISALPKKWLMIIKNKDCTQYVPPNGEVQVRIDQRLRNIKDITCKDFYWTFVKRITATPKCIAKWNKYLLVPHIDWSYHFKLPYLTTRVTSLQSFQYKILHRFYPCNYNLSIWFNDESELCNECLTEVDYLEHFFYQCKDVRMFWRTVEIWLHNSFHMSIKLSTSDILFGIHNVYNDKLLDIFNYVILWGKWYLSIIKMKDKQPSLSDFLIILKIKLETEETYCRVNNKIIMFQERWQPLYPAIEAVINIV